jgi:hypothetical protein
MLALVLTKPNGKWLGGLLSPAEAQQLALHLYEWANAQDAALGFRPAPVAPPGEHQGSRRVTMSDLVAFNCRHIGCTGKRSAGSYYCERHQQNERSRKAMHGGGQ